jgi:hypothetical protein
MNVGRKLLALIGAVALVGIAGTTGAAGAGGRPLSTGLNPAEEVPPPGDTDATGHADLTLNQGEGEICYDLSWSNIDGTVVAAHIHQAPAGVAGPVVVPLPTLGDTGSVSNCVAVDPALVKAIRKNPSDYYVNVHSTPDFPAGAVRGQLGD